MSKLPRLKVKVTGQDQRIYPWILCPLHISWTLEAIFIKLHPNITFSEIMCRSYDSATQTCCQGHNWRSCYLPFNLCPLHISWTVWTSFIKLHSNVPLIGALLNFIWGLLFEKTYLIVIKDETDLKSKLNASTLILIGSYVRKLVASYLKRGR